MPDLSILSTSRIITLTFAVALGELAMFVPVTYLASYAMAHNQSPQFAYRLLTLLNVSSLLGRWIPRYLRDKLGFFNSQIAVTIMCLTSVLAL
jgi:predicted MFS family arabinose efflux permease